jgi:hypothetical protein
MLTVVRALQSNWQELCQASVRETQSGVVYSVLATQVLFSRLAINFSFEVPQHLPTRMGITNMLIPLMPAKTALRSVRLYSCLTRNKFQPVNFTHHALGWMQCSELLSSSDGFTPS